MGHDDAGFPILKPDRSGEGYHLVGYIGANELEHALGKFRSIY
jgi:chloride channel 3/4/5